MSNFDPLDAEIEYQSNIRRRIEATSNIVRPHNELLKAAQQHLEQQNRALAKCHAALILARDVIHYHFAGSWQDEHGRPLAELIDDALKAIVS